jgi:hypothetical protein
MDKEKDKERRDANVREETKEQLDNKVFARKVAEDAVMGVARMPTQEEKETEAVMEEVCKVARKLDEEIGNQSKDNDDENLKNQGAKSGGDEEDNGSDKEDEQEEDDNNNEREAETLPKWNGYMPPDFYYYKEGRKKQGQLNLKKAIWVPGYNSLEQYNSCQVVNIFLDQYTGNQEYNEEGCKYLLYMLIGMCARDGWLGMSYFSESGIAKMFYEAKKLYDEAAVE